MKSEKYDDFEKYIRQSLESSFEEDGLTVSDELFNRTLSAIRNLEAEDAGATEAESAGPNVRLVGREETAGTAASKVEAETTEKAVSGRASKKKIYRLVYAASGIAAAVLLAVVGIGIVAGNNRMKSSDSAADAPRSVQSESASEKYSQAEEPADAFGAAEAVEAPMAASEEYAYDAEPDMTGKAYMSTPTPTAAPEEAALENSMILQPGTDTETGDDGNVLTDDMPRAVAVEDGPDFEPESFDEPGSEDLTGQNKGEFPQATDGDNWLLEGEMKEDGTLGEVDTGTKPEGRDLTLNAQALVEGMTGATPEEFDGEIYVLYENMDRVNISAFRKGVEELEKTEFEIGESTGTIEQHAGGSEGAVKGSIVIIFDRDLKGTVYYVLGDDMLYVSDFDSRLNLGERSGYYLEDAEDMEALLAGIGNR